jgi:phenylalanyl-tRNA synthetase alpha chain
MGRKIKIYLRPSYFPFTLSTFEVDMEINGKLYEIAGAGLMHPKVLSRGGIEDPVS